MKKNAAATLLALIFVVFLSGCATRRVAAYPPVHSRTRISISTETRSIRNASDFLLVPQEDGLAVEKQVGFNKKDPKFEHRMLKTGEAVPLNYFQLSGRRTISLVIVAYCPESGTIVSGRMSRARNQETISCIPGQYMGTSRPKLVTVNSRTNRYGSRDLIYYNQDILNTNRRPYY